MGDIKISVGKSSSNKKVIIIAGIMLIILIAVLIYVFVSNSTKTSGNNANVIGNENNNENSGIVPDNEKVVSDSKAQSIYAWLPKIYKEAISPFDDRFMLDTVMDKISESSKEEGPDYSTDKVDKMIKEIFGSDKVIDKNKVSTQDIHESVYYYDFDNKTYAAIPVGLEGLFRMQMLKEVTETNKSYYVYTYMLLGQYSVDYSGAQDNPDVNYDELPVTVVIGDKDGNDLVKTFDNFSNVYNETEWLKSNKDSLPIFRYTLDKSGDSYYLTEVEQIGY